MPGNDAITQAAIDEFLRQNFGAAFNTVFGQQTSQQNPFGKWVRGMQEPMYNQYLGKVADNPNLDFLGFLTGLGLDTGGNRNVELPGMGWNPQQVWGNMVPSQRGETPSRFAPAVRWLQTFGGRS